MKTPNHSNLLITMNDPIAAPTNKSPTLPGRTLAGYDVFGKNAKTYGSESENNHEAKNFRITLFE